MEIKFITSTILLLLSVSVCNCTLTYKVTSYADPSMQAEFKKCNPVIISFMPPIIEASASLAGICNSLTITKNDTKWNTNLDCGNKDLEDFTIKVIQDTLKSGKDTSNLKSIGSGKNKINLTNKLYRMLMR